MAAPAPSPLPDSNFGVDTYTPAPSPSPEWKIQRSWNKLDSTEGHMYEAAAYILISVTFLVSIMILRSIRHRTGWSSVKWVLRAFTYIALLLLPYLLGVLDNSPFQPQLKFAWAVFIIVLAGTVDNAGNENLEEIEASRKRLLLDYSVLSILVFFILIFNLLIKSILTIPVLILWTMFLLGLKEKKLALVAACRTRDGLDRIAKVIADFMKLQEHNIPSTNDHSDQPDEPNPITMQGYRYLVGVKKAVDQVNSEYPPCHDKPLDLNNIATIEDIWQCKGRLLGKNSEHLKDTCLSFAMFWLLLRRFAGYELKELSSEETRQKTWKFVRQGLIEEQGDGEECKRAFRVVEVELEFLHEFFFNTYFAFYCRGKRLLLLRLGVMASYIVVSIVTLSKIHSDKSRPRFEKTNLETKISRLVIWVLCAVEFGLIVVIVTSKWMKVKWVCNYVKERWWETRWGRYKEALLYKLCHAPCFRFFFKPWQRQLIHQYSLLDSYGHTPTILRFKWVLDGYFDLPLKGRKESKPTSLSTEVKKAVIMSLQTNGQRLSNGVASLGRNNVQDMLSWACENNESTTRVVLVWHIATSICEIRLKDPADFAVNLDVASSLSKYCAYLVAFAPKLLPDHVYSTQLLFEQAVTDARKTLKHCNSEENKCEELTKVSEEGAHGSILEQGALLGNHLMNGIKDEGLRWKVLADFWAEMILFLAPSNQPAAHAECLVTGGQFITHLWALLTHAGIVDRDGHGG